MKTIKVVAAVICDSIKDKKQILATARGYGEFKGQWEFPGGKIEKGETPQQALVREIKEELEVNINVGELIDTIEYDYPAFHLSMDCFWAEIICGQIVLKEAEDAKWLTIDKLNSVKWLPADVALISCIKNNMRVQEMLTRKVSVEKLNEEKTKKLWGEIIVGVGGQEIEWCYTDVLYSFKSIIDILNVARKLYLNGGEYKGENYDSKDKQVWWQMIQLLPSSYNQTRNVMMNYEVLANIYKSRRGHKLDEWCDFCKWIETLPYSEIIMSSSGLDLNSINALQGAARNSSKGYIHKRKTED